MRGLRICTIFLATLLPLAAEDWVTADGKTYKNVTVLGQEDDGVRISYDGGVGKVPYYELPVDVQKRFSQDIDSLASKKKAIDKAIEAAVRSAADAQILTQNPAGSAASSQPATTPGTAATPATPATAASPGAPAAMPAQNTAAAGSGAAPNAATNSSNPAGPAASAGATSPASTAAAANPPTASPSTNASPAAKTSAAGKPDNSAAPESLGPVKVPGANDKYPGANFTYNTALDVCYLDSPTVDLVPEAPRPRKNPNAGCSLMFRVVTDGSQAERPDRIEATFLSVGDPGHYSGMHVIGFTIDDAAESIDDSARKDTGTLSGGGQAVEYISFYLTMDQVRKIGIARKVDFSVSPDNFTVGNAGLSQLQQYIHLVDGLPPAQSSFLRSAYKTLAKIPSFFSALSTICEYVILGSFALLVMAMIAAFVLGVSRFIKM